MATVIRCLYTIGLYLALPFILLSLLLKRRRSSEYGKRINERFTIYSNPKFSKSIWVHAVSLGETIAAIPLINNLLLDYPQYEIVVTTTTPTGSAKVKQAFGDKVFHVYAPYDYPLAIQRFIRYTKPHLAIIMETELWPNIIHNTRKHKIPTIIANGRLSAKSTKGYSYIPFLVKSMLQQLTIIAAQSDIDAKRFQQLGAKKYQLLVTGNIKFDIKPPENISTIGSNLRQKWGVDRKVWIAASTHQGEDEIMLDSLQQLKNRIPNILLILVPRHPERFDSVYELCRQYGFKVAKHSRQDTCAKQTDIILGDTIGELINFYAASDIALVGGSFNGNGGHNLLEPAAVGIPVLSGPNLFNFEAIKNALLAKNALIMVNDSHELVANLINLFDNAALRKSMCENALQVVRDNQGATRRIMEIITHLLDKSWNNNVFSPKTILDK